MNIFASIFLVVFVAGKVFQKIFRILKNYFWLNLYNGSSYLGTPISLKMAVAERI